MFTLLRRLIKEGAPVDSVYARMTPLCAALTCGKKRSGDVRMVRVLLNAKAAVNKKNLEYVHMNSFRGTGLSTPFDTTKAIKKQP